MARFTCDHELPKGRIGTNLAHVPRDNSNRCPGCQTKSPSGVIGLLKNLQKPAPDPQKPRDAAISQHLITFAFDRFISQRKAAGFKARLGEVFGVFGETCYLLLDRKQIASFSITARGKWGIEVTKQAWRAVGAAVLKTNGVYQPIQPARAEILTTLNNMIEFMRGRAAAVDTFEQLEIVYSSASTLRMLRDDVTSALSSLEDGFTKWDAVGK
ncbi:hypothetical protein F4820DRAFT_323033 [Hypoxylon rubiginosum]|uniref:Uncharacterized protein n=1 Tax=Hypoxylon rubiginosum TaxID=110542 RepID=A0ACB9Z0V8_9PEZI|nr:hypothetical protein F4820DRAFT_323033 [Hypoxylon rubiginosum]